MSLAERVREYVRTAYVEPARQRNEETIRVVAGDVARALELRNRTPAVCQALGGRKFLKENDLLLERLDAPPSGLSTRAAFVFRLQHPQAKTSWVESFLQLRGVGKEVYASFGGGEEYLRKERENFYSPGKDPLGDFGEPSSSGSEKDRLG